jgi:hypothetical protein
MVKSVIYLLFSYLTGYIMWHSRLMIYIPFGCFPYLWRHSSMTSKYVSRHISCMMSDEGKYCTQFLNQYSFICSKFYKLYKYNINIITVNSVTNTWSIQQTHMFHGCTITNKQNVEPWKLSTSWGHTKVLFIIIPYYTIDSVKRNVLSSMF